jgi:hypothetical protein
MPGTRRSTRSPRVTQHAFPRFGKCSTFTAEWFPISESSTTRAARFAAAASSGAEAPRASVRALCHGALQVDHARVDRAFPPTRPQPHPARTHPTVNLPRVGVEPLPACGVRGLREQEAQESHSPRRVTSFQRLQGAATCLATLLQQARAGALSTRLGMGQGTVYAAGSHTKTALDHAGALSLKASGGRFDSRFSPGARFLSGWGPRTRVALGHLFRVLPQELLQGVLLDPN